MSPARRERIAGNRPARDRAFIAGQAALGAALLAVWSTAPTAALGPVRAVAVAVAAGVGAVLNGLRSGLR